MRPLTFTIALILSIFGAKAEAASFDCRGSLAPVEEIICSDNSLSRKDDEVSERYSAAKRAEAANDPQAANVKDSQRLWMRGRNQCTDFACVDTMYDRRLAELASFVRAQPMPSGTQSEQADAPMETSDAGVDQADVTTPTVSEPVAQEYVAPPQPDTNSSKSSDGALLAGISIFLILTVLIGAIFYFIPTFIALARKHHSAPAIIAVNVLAGWTAIGWFVALIWSLTAPSSHQTIIVNQNTRD